MKYIDVRLNENRNESVVGNDNVHSYEEDGDTARKEFPRRGMRKLRESPRSSTGYDGVKDNKS